MKQIACKNLKEFIDSRMFSYSDVEGDQFVVHPGVYEFLEEDGKYLNIEGCHFLAASYVVLRLNSKFESNSLSYIKMKPLLNCPGAVEKSEYLIEIYHNEDGLVMNSSEICIRKINEESFMQVDFSLDESVDIFICREGDE